MQYFVARLVSINGIHLHRVLFSKIKFRISAFTIFFYGKSSGPSRYITLVRLCNTGMSTYLHMHWYILHNRTSMTYHWCIATYCSVLVHSTNWYVSVPICTYTPFSSLIGQSWFTMFKLGIHINLKCNSPDLHSANVRYFIVINWRFLIIFVILTSLNTLT